MTSKSTLRRPCWVAYYDKLWLRTGRCSALHLANWYQLLELSE